MCRCFSLTLGLLLLVATPALCQVSYNPALPLAVGTRDVQGQPYLLVLNQSAAPVTVTFTLQGLRAAPSTVVDAFTGTVVTTITNNRFTLTLPALGVGSGTAIYALTAGERPRLVTGKRPAPTRLRLLTTR